MFGVCAEAGLSPPEFEEIGTNFRVTLFNSRISLPRQPDWEIKILEHLERTNGISTQEAARIWKTSDRTARTRLRKLVTQRKLTEIGTSPKDPRRMYVLKYEKKA